MARHISIASVDIEKLILACLQIANAREFDALVSNISPLDLISGFSSPCEELFLGSKLREIHLQALPPREKAMCAFGQEQI
jgi:hypothetical protein